MNKKKNGTTFKLLGYTEQEFMRHIESTWEPWMNWKNYGITYKLGKPRTWNVDHIKPVAAFVKEGCFNMKMIGALSNLRAMDSRKNASKNDKFINEERVCSYMFK
jgi:hypothetical protein